jgi:hypothetical protein
MKIIDAERTRVVDIPDELTRRVVGIFKDMMDSGAEEGQDPVSNLSEANLTIRSS